MRTIRVELEFDGAGFEGWQRQVRARTVQGVAEAALEQILGSPHGVVGAGPTHAGVHALGMLASFRTEHPMDAVELERALDAVLPADVGVRSLCEADPAFHAQRDAAWKWYRYSLLLSRRKQPLSEARSWRIPSAPEMQRLALGAAALEGTHDFASFANTGSSPGPTTVRTLHTARFASEGDHLEFDVVGDGFLYKMVRTLVGTLLDVARQDEPERAIRRILDQQDRRAAGRAAPARGLCLMAVAVRNEPAPDRVPFFLRPPVESAGQAMRGDLD